MTRRSSRLSESGPGQHKRVASAEIATNAASKKPRTQKASSSSSSKSKYFSAPDETEETEGDSETNEDGSDFEDAPVESQVSDVEEDDSSDSDHTPASKRKSASNKGTPKASEIWRPGVKTGEWLACPLSLPVPSISC
jgi:hypothetical protein